MAARKKTSSKAAKDPALRRGRADTAAGVAEAGDPPVASVRGRKLVIVESPAKAKTINKYLGGDFVVKASVGHIRDLPGKAPKGSKQPVPGVDLENDFEPEYQVLPEKQKIATELRKAAREASEIWFATDLDREGEAIAWHLAELLGVKAEQAKRVVFNAITKDEIRRAFEHPRQIDLDKVNAQQARRILDRIVGYQVSPLLWKKVARGTSAGRVQSVALRLIVEREREIRAFIPDERWQIDAEMTFGLDLASKLGPEWERFQSTPDARGRVPNRAARLKWLSEHKALECELVELNGEKFEIGATALESVGVATSDGSGLAPGAAAGREPLDLTAAVMKAAEATGLVDISVESKPDPEGKGPASIVRTVRGRIGPGVRYTVESIERKRTTSRPYPPFITSSLQIGASSVLGFHTDRTMALAQQLYQGVAIPGEGPVALITYMRTDSTHLSGEAIGMARDHIGRAFGTKYLPEKPNFFGSSNKAAQEAHEAIRPTDVTRTPASLRGKLSEEQWKLYDLIWRRFVACQMVNAEWDSTSVTLRRSDEGAPKPASKAPLFKASGRQLAFDGFYKAFGEPESADDPVLPAELKEGAALAPFSIEPIQKFTNPPPRFTEASLVKKLEEEGIGRPSTYASIINTIERQKYVEQVDRRFHATDRGMVVSDKLVQGFPDLMDVGYTREMEKQLDLIEEEHISWQKMLRDFYGPFREALDHADERMTHAKAELVPAIYACPKCGSRTAYRFGKNGRFLSCTAYPECDFASPIDRDGRPQLTQKIDLLCPVDGSPMVLRTGRFGDFLTSENPKTKFVLNLDKKKRTLKFPAPPPLVTDLKCTKCDAALNLREGKRGPWLGCSRFPKCRGREPWAKVDDATKKKLEASLAEAVRRFEPLKLTRLDGKTPVANGTPLDDLMLPGEQLELAVHPDAQRELRKAG
ncbi:MAG: topoisomerase DNA-binding C4 zinc finger domain-containing protein [Phycisphaeraceae bacterium]|nr:topoisomerase DNA-binding C4 zinc finger domain-containing protein [Phycisphaeraceae bacterium]